MNIRFILATLGLLSAMSLSAERIAEKCLEKDSSGNCVRSVFVEDMYLVNSCKAPAQATCTASTTLGERTATCTAKPGNECLARVKMNASQNEMALQILKGNYKMFPFFNQ